MLDAVARDIAAYLKQHTIGLLDKYNVDVRTGTKCVEITENAVTIEKGKKREIIACGAVIYATGARSNNDVEEMIKTTGIPYSVIGDAKRTGKIMNAIRQGNELARGL